MTADGIKHGNKGGRLRQQRANIGTAPFSAAPLGRAAKSSATHL